MFKRLILTYLTIVFFFYSANSFSLENKIIVKIEEDIITSIDIENESKYLLLLNKKIKNLKKEEIFNVSKRSIIREKIQNIELSKTFKDLKVPEEYLNQILKNVYQEIGINDLDNFKKYLEENNVDYDHVKKKIETEALWNQLIIAKFSSKIIINENEIRKKLKENNNIFSKSFLVSEIFFETTNTDEVQIFYNNIKRTIEKEGFEKAALTHSSSNTSSSGGKLGWIKEETLNENLKKIFGKMNEGEFTNPITIPGGFLILKINEIKKVKKNQNIEKEVKKITQTKKNNQLNQFSKMHFNKIKKDIQINEF
jgi:peptidyl-prolyl cis-trans isomerase SurA